MRNVDIASYADDNAPYIAEENIDQIISALENSAVSLFKWFSDNQLKANPHKCDFLITETCKRKLRLLATL